MTKILIAILVLAVSSVFGQSTGYLGKKHTVSLAGTFRSPLFFNIDNAGKFNSLRNNKLVDGDLVESKNYMDLGYNLTYGYAFSRKFGLAINYSSENFEFFPRDNSFNSTSYNEDGQNVYWDLISSTYGYGKHKSIQAGLVLSSKQGVLPFGLSHELGGGTGRFIVDTEKTAVKVKETITTYDVETNETTYNTETKIYQGEQIMSSSFAIKTYTAYYKLKMYYPVSEFLLINVGLNYTLNWTSFTNSQFNNDPYRVFSNRDLESGISNKLFRSFARFELGAVFPFGF